MPCSRAKRDSKSLLARKVAEVVFDEEVSWVCEALYSDVEKGAFAQHSSTPQLELEQKAKKLLTFIKHRAELSTDRTMRVECILKCFPHGAGIHTGQEAHDEVRRLLDELNKRRKRTAF